MVQARGCEIPDQTIFYGTLFGQLLDKPKQSPIKLAKLHSTLLFLLTTDVAAVVDDGCALNDVLLMMV